MLWGIWRQLGHNMQARATPLVTRSARGAPNHLANFQFFRENLAIFATFYQFYNMTRTLTGMG